MNTDYMRGADVAQLKVPTDPLEAVEQERVRTAYRAVTNLKEVILVLHGSDSAQWREIFKAKKILAEINRDDRR